MKLDPKLKAELKNYVTKRLMNREQKVTVVSPYKLSEKELTELTHNIPDLKRAEIENTVDPSILAGVVIQFGSQMIDLTIDGELKNVKQRIDSV